MDTAEKLDLILLELKQINTKLNQLTQEVESLKKTVNRMDGHIDFVEETYDTLKFPIHVVKKKIEQIFGKEKKGIE